MMGHVSDSSTEKHEQSYKLKSIDPSPICGDLSTLSDAFLDFDSIKEWIEEFPNPDMSRGECESLIQTDESLFVNDIDFMSKEEGITFEGGGAEVKFPVRDLVSNVCMGEVSENLTHDSACDGSSETESCSSSSTSSSRSDDNDDEDGDDYSFDKEREGVAIGLIKVEEIEDEIEEGEIREPDMQKVECSEIYGDEDDDDDDVGVSARPIRSKNEVKFCQVLPLVPQVSITLQAHHHLFPLGAVLSIVDGVQVIIEGTEKNGPLNEGSVLWITETRAPLGYVDEIFGPVKSAYYVVRYNSEEEIPHGISEGTLVSYAAEFAELVLNDNNLYEKGYDASGENDEELSDEVEFSDDEKEAEYKRSLNVNKRNASGRKHEKFKMGRDIVASAGAVITSQSSVVRPLPNLSRSAGLTKLPCGIWKSSFSLPRPINSRDGENHRGVPMQGQMCLPTGSGPFCHQGGQTLPAVVPTQNQLGQVCLSSVVCQQFGQALPVVMPTQHQPGQPSLAMSQTVQARVQTQPQMGQMLVAGMPGYPQLGQILPFGPHGQALLPQQFPAGMPTQQQPGQTIPGRMPSQQQILPAGMQNQPQFRQTFPSAMLTQQHVTEMFPAIMLSEQQFGQVFPGIPTQHQFGQALPPGIPTQQQFVQALPPCIPTQQQLGQTLPAGVQAQQQFMQTFGVGMPPQQQPAQQLPVFGNQQQPGQVWPNQQQHGQQSGQALSVGLPNQQVFPTAISIQQQPGQPLPAGIPNQQQSGQPFPAGLMNQHPPGQVLPAVLPNQQQHGQQSMQASPACLPKQQPLPATAPNQQQSCQALPPGMSSQIGQTITNQQLPGQALPVGTTNQQPSPNAFPAGMPNQQQLQRTLPGGIMASQQAGYAFPGGMPNQHGHAFPVGMRNQHQYGQALAAGVPAQHFGQALPAGMQAPQQPWQALPGLMQVQQQIGQALPGQVFMPTLSQPGQVSMPNPAPNFAHRPPCLSLSGQEAQTASVQQQEIQNEQPGRSSESSAIDGGQPKFQARRSVNRGSSYGNRPFRRGGARNSHRGRDRRGRS